MSRSRTCIPEAYGGKNCSFLEDQAKKSNQSVYKQVQVCLNLPNCSIPATLTPWSEWSSCTTKCHCPGRSIPQSEKRRSCNEAVLSTAEELNTDITVCSQFEELNMEMKRNCNGTQCTCERDWTLYEDSCFLFDCRHGHAIQSLYTVFVRTSFRRCASRMYIGFTSITTNSEYLTARHRTY